MESQDIQNIVKAMEQCASVGDHDGYYRNEIVLRRTLFGSYDDKLEGAEDSNTMSTTTPGEEDDDDVPDDVTDDWTVVSSAKKGRRPMRYMGFIGKELERLETAHELPGLAKAFMDNGGSRKDPRRWAVAHVWKDIEGENRDQDPGILGGTIATIEVDVVGGPLSRVYLRLLGRVEFDEPSQ